MATLLNLGNTCAVNSILQCIAKANFKIDTIQIPEPGSYTIILLNLVHSIRQKINKTISPKIFINKLYNTFNIFVRNEQIDAQELWIMLCNKVASETSTNTETLPHIKNVLNSKLYVQAEQQISKHNEGKFSVWMELFQGIMLSTFICKNCSHAAHRFEPFYTLELIPDIDIVKMLKTFFEYNEDNSTTIICDKCNKGVHYRRYDRLYYIPNYVVFTIKRFDNLGNKIRTPMNINRNIQISTKSYEKKLELVACVFHHGISVHGGHYAMYSALDNCIYDDSSKIEIDFDILKDNKDIYMVFYRIV